MRRRVLTAGAAIVQFQVQLRHVLPPVWRRIQLPAAATMADLHEVLQETIGWTNSHLHEFQTDTDRIGMPDPEVDYEDEVRDEGTVLVGDVATPGARLHDVYDFGDNWRHDLTVELIAVAHPGARYPRCLDGAGACPPEDCGACGDPHHFDVAEADRALARLAWKNTVPGPVAPKVARTRPEPPPLRLDPETDEAPPATITLRCTGKMTGAARAARVAAARWRRAHTKRLPKIASCL